MAETKVALSSSAPTSSTNYVHPSNPISEPVSQTNFYSSFVLACMVCNKVKMRNRAYRVSDKKERWTETISGTRQYRKRKKIRG